MTTKIKEFFWGTMGDKILFLTIVYPSGRMRTFDVVQKQGDKKP